jgi:hypothetical protein
MNNQIKLQVAKFPKRNAKNTLDTMKNCLGKDQLKPIQSGIHVINGFLYGTNGHIIVRIADTHFQAHAGKIIAPNYFSIASTGIDREIYLTGQYPDCEGVLKRVFSEFLTDWISITDLMGKAKHAEKMAKASDSIFLGNIPFQIGKQKILLNAGFLFSALECLYLNGAVFVRFEGGSSGITPVKIVSDNGNIGVIAPVAHYRPTLGIKRPFVNPVIYSSDREIKRLHNDIQQVKFKIQGPFVAEILPAVMNVPPAPTGTPLPEKKTKRQLLSIAEMCAKIKPLYELALKDNKNECPKVATSLSKDKLNYLVMVCKELKCVTISLTPDSIVVNHEKGFGQFKVGDMEMGILRPFITDIAMHYSVPVSDYLFPNEVQIIVPEPIIEQPLAIKEDLIAVNLEIVTNPIAIITQDGISYEYSQISTSVTYRPKLSYEPPNPEKSMFIDKDGIMWEYRSGWYPKVNEPAHNVLMETNCSPEVALQLIEIGFSQQKYYPPEIWDKVTAVMDQICLLGMGVLKSQSGKDGTRYLNTWRLGTTEIVNSYLNSLIVNYICLQ